MERRDFLRTATAVVGTCCAAGCIGGSQTPDGGSDTTPRSTPSPTPDRMPDSCGSMPDVDGLPAPPESLNEEPVIDYVREFERTYGVATNDDYRGIASLDVTHAERDGESYRVQLAVEAEPVTPTPSEDGSTPTPRPADATAYRVSYGVTDDRLVRELRGYPSGGELSTTCWRFDGE